MNFHLDSPHTLAHTQHAADTIGPHFLHHIFAHMQHVADAMAPGDHGSTFAGNPLVCATACTVFDIINTPAFLASVEAKSERIKAGLRKVTAGNPHVKVSKACVQCVCVCVSVFEEDLVNANHDLRHVNSDPDSRLCVRLYSNLVRRMEDQSWIELHVQCMDIVCYSTRAYLYVNSVSDFNV